MDFQEFVLLVSILRDMQKQYLVSKNKDDLALARSIAAKVDEAVDYLVVELADPQQLKTKEKLRSILVECPELDKQIPF